MDKFNIALNCRIKELSEEKQLLLIRLINHLASMPVMYQATVCDRLQLMINENPWTDEVPGLNKALFNQLESND
tara:strand:- start:71 stop:292 length:222 start_codon:yes stop_codon:yes gene_type:complete